METNRAFHSYKIVYKNGKYVSIGYTCKSKMRIEVYLDLTYFASKHNRYVRQKFRYLNNLLGKTYNNIYGNRKETKAGFGDEFYRFEFQNLIVMNEVLSKILDYLNSQLNLVCKGCDMKFDNLKKCISHKGHCDKLWTLTKNEEGLMNYLKTIEKTSDLYNLDKSKEVVYIYGKDNNYNARPFDGITCTDEIKLLGDSVIYETERYTLLGKCKLSDEQKNKIREFDVGNITSQ